MLVKNVHSEMRNVDHETSDMQQSTTSKDAVKVEYGPTGKRLDYISWHQLHMYMARTLGEMSTRGQRDGCYIVDQEHYHVASGYSGENMSKNTNPDCAIMAALRKLEKDRDYENCILYTTRFPCCDQCAEKILELRIPRVWYWESINSEAKTERFNALKSNNVQCEKYIPSQSISIDFHNFKTKP